MQQDYLPNVLLSFFSAELVGYVMLRLIKPIYSINPAWCEENLSSATKRALSILHTYPSPNSTSILASHVEQMLG